MSVFISVKKIKKFMHTKEMISNTRFDKLTQNGEYFHAQRKNIL